MITDANGLQTTIVKTCYLIKNIPKLLLDFLKFRVTFRFLHLYSNFLPVISHEYYLWLWDFLILLGITLFSLSIYDTQLKSSERTLKKLQIFKKPFAFTLQFLTWWVKICDFWNAVFLKLHEKLTTRTLAHLKAVLLTCLRTLHKLARTSSAP